MPHGRPTASRKARTETCCNLRNPVPSALLANPTSGQYLLLEPFDNRRGSELAQHAHESRLIGSTQSRVRAFLGEPSRIKEYAPGALTWEYKQLPGYWFGSHFQVFFGTTGLVEGFEANDD
ncbi:MAG: hypothetical protein IPJ85_03560 [Flavobacteriales bacterium]|nr:hypothetical protein [Flavobacteriales bacterium]